MSPNPDAPQNPSLKRRMLAGGESLFSIGDMARLYSVSLRTLRFYEDRGLIAPYRQGVARFYDAACRARLETILKGKQLGFTLTQIAAMLPPAPAAQGGDSLPAALKLEEAQVSAQLQRLERRREEMDAAIAELRRAQTALGGQSAGENLAQSAA